MCRRPSTSSGPIRRPRRGAAKRIQAVFPTWKNIEQYDGDKDVVPGVKPINTNGHTPGHMSYLVGSGRKPADRARRRHEHSGAVRARTPDGTRCSTCDGPLAETNRRKIFDRVVADKATITGYHFGMPGAGTIKKDGKGYAFVPVKA